ncbi:MAG: tRNA (guanosine(37)-N1)-methyltransferase TrmD [bacterium]|nr:tRNA (guanosine(37)-N1)-methyltransferase TrmD [bacterium]
MLDSYIQESILKRAQAANLIKITAHNLRDYSNDRHNKVDDSPFGGGPGMVFKVEPVYRAVQFLKSKVKGQRSKIRVILFSTRGKKFDAKVAKRLAKYDELILICGRYEGVDERVAEHIADEEISMGDYVLSGGELPAMIVIDAVSRQIPGVLGKTESLEEVKGSYPVYTKPAQFKPAKKGKSWDVPKVLLSGDHKEIEKFRKFK